MGRGAVFAYQQRVCCCVRHCGKNVWEAIARLKAGAAEDKKGHQSPTEEEDR